MYATEMKFYECAETKLRDRRPCTTACTACWAMGTNELKQYTVRKKIFCTGPSSSQGRTTISCTGMKSPPTNQPMKIPFHLYSLSPHSPQIQQAAGTTSLQSLWYESGSNSARFACKRSLHIANDIRRPTSSKNQIVQVVHIKVLTLAFVTVY